MQQIQAFGAGVSDIFEQERVKPSAGRLQPVARLLGCLLQIIEDRGAEIASGAGRYSRNTAKSYGGRN
jgi:hypothetical protein